MIEEFLKSVVLNVLVIREQLQNSAYYAFDCFRAL